MTSIVYRDGIIAADSLVTLQTETGGSRKFLCEKLYRKKTKDDKEVIIATAGESSPSLVFLDWYGTGRKPPKALIDSGADFTCLVLSEKGLFEFDAWCRGDEIKPALFPHGYAIGSGAKAALGALYHGATAEEACEIATRIDPYSAPPVVTMRL